MTRTVCRRGQSKVATILLVSAGLLLLLMLAIFFFGNVRGEEFAPQRFAQRSFSYYQIPVLKVQVWPVSISNRSNDLAKHLRANRLLGSVSSRPVRWDLVSMSQTWIPTYRGDASILTNYLEQPGAAGSESWLDWSQNNPKLAQELWPIVARTAQEDIYVLIPPLFEAARRAKSADELARQLREVLVAELVEFARAEQQRGNGTRQRELLDIAREYDPDNRRLQAES